MIFTDMGFINGLMEDNIMDNGNTIKWMGLVLLYGLMEENTQEAY